MKAYRLKFLLVGCLLYFTAFTVKAQRYITNGIGYACYNYFDSNTIDNTNNNNTGGVYAPGFLPDPNVGTNNTSVVVSAAATNSLAAASGRCLQSLFQSTPKGLAVNYIPNATDASFKTSLDNNDWEWSLIYNCSLGSGVRPSTPSTTIGATLTTATNSWRYWLSASSSTFSTSMDGFYLTQDASGFLRVYVVKGGSASPLIVSNAALTNGTSYCIKIQRNVSGYWKMYLDPLTATVTQAQTLQTSRTNGSDGQNVSLAYGSSYLEAENTSTATNGAFKFDEMHMYTRYLKYTGITSTANGITPSPLYYNEGTVILYGMQIQSRGNYEMGSQIYFSSTGSNAQGNFTGGANLYRTTNSVFAVSGSTLVYTGLSLFDNNTQTNSGFSDTYVSNGNTDGSATNLGYYFLTSTLQTSSGSINTSGTLTYNGFSSIYEKKSASNNSAATIVNSAGTTAPITFTGPTAPTVTTNAVTGIWGGVATVGGNITSLGVPATVTEYGVVYSSTVTTPTTANSKFLMGTGATTTTSYSAPLDGLAPNTTYYVRAYAINATGISYGAATSFTTLAAPNISYVTPQTYPLNTPISSLAPTNTGGVVPLNTYLATNTFATGLSSNYFITFDAAGNLYEADDATGNVYKIPAGGGTRIQVNSTTVSATANDLTGIAVDQSGNVYVSGYNSNSLFKISSTGTVSTLLNTSPLNGPMGLVMDNAGNLYIANYGGGNILKVAYGANTATSYATGFTTPYGVAFDNTGSLYVTDRAGYIYKGVSGASKTQIGTTFGSPTGISVAADGSIYFSDVTSDNIKVIPAGSTTATSILSTGLNNPRSVMLDNTGNFLYIANTDANTIIKQSVTGYTYTGTLPTGLSFDYTTGTITGTPTAVTVPAGNTLIITAYNSAGNDAATLTIIVNPGAPTVAPVSPLCGAQTVSLTASGGLPAGGTYNWYSAASGGTAIATTAAYSPFIGGTTTLYVSYTSGIGTSARTAVTVTVNQKASSSINSPMLSYPFEGGSLTDWSGLGNNGTLQGSTLPTATADRNGVANNAYVFSGTNASPQYISTTTQYDPLVYSYSIWFKTTVGGGKLIGIGGNQTGSNNTQDRNLYMSNTGQLYYGVYNGGQVTINTTTTYIDGLWHHVIVTDGPTNGMRIYVDGTLQASTATYTVPQQIAEFWRIGGDNLSGWPNRPSNDYFTGTLDDVAIYNHELTAAEAASNDMNLYKFSSAYCANNSLTITAQTIPGATYSWVDNTTPTITGTGNPVTFTNASATNYTLTTTVSGCTQANAIVTPATQTYTWTGAGGNTAMGNNLNWTNTSTGIVGTVVSGAPSYNGTETIIIPTGLSNYPVLDNSSRAMFTLNIANGATLSLNGFTLSVGCNIFNPSGGKILYGPGALASASANASGIIWNGTTTITNQSYTGSTTANTAQLGTMTVNNTAPAGTVTINSGTLDIYSLLTMTAGNLAVTSPAVLTLKSSAAQSANVGVIPPANSITGLVNVERYFNGGAVATYRGYRLVSSAVNTNSVTNNTGNTALYSLDFLSTSPSSIFTAGPGGTGSGFTSLGAGNSTIYLYREDLSSSGASFNGGNFKGVYAINTGTTTFPVANTAGNGSTSTTLPVGNGYMLYYIGDKTLVAGKVTRSGGKFADPESSTSTATGTLNQGDVPVQIWFRPNTFLSYTNIPAIHNSISPSYARAFNLVGNPYPSSIDWDKFTNGVADPGTGIYGPNLKNSVYVFDYRSKNYGVYQQGTAGGTGTRNSSHIIVSGQGFFVKVDSSKTFTAAKLTFHEGAKVNTQNTGNALLFKSALAPQLLRIKLSQDSINADDIILTFEPEAKNEYESDKDADYLQGIGSAVSLTSYAFNSDKKLAINHMHSIDESTRIKLYASASSSAILDTLSATGFDSLDPHFDVYLIDHYKKDSIFFSKYKQYLFNVDRNDASSYGSERFELVFHKNSEYNYHLLGFTAKVAKNGALLNWKVEKETTFTNFTIERDNGSGQFISLYTVLSNGSSNYTYLDKSPLTGVNNYRLKQIDAFGNITYSMATLNFNGQISTTDDFFSIYPNPVITQFNIKITTSAIPKQVQVRVTDLMGNTVINTKNPGDNIRINAYNLIPGGYIVEVIDSSTGKILGQKKLIKQ